MKGSLTTEGGTTTWVHLTTLKIDQDKVEELKELLYDTMISKEKHGHFQLHKES